MTTDAATGGHPVINRDGVMVPFWAWMMSTMMFAAVAGGALYWSFIIVTSSYYQGFNDGWAKSQSVVRPPKLVQERILPEPTDTKSNQPPG